MKKAICTLLLSAIFSVSAFAAPIDAFVGVWKFPVPIGSNGWINIMKLKKIDDTTIGLNYCTEADYQARGDQCEAFPELGSGSVLWKYDPTYGGICNNYTQYFTPSTRLDAKSFECLNAFKIPEGTSSKLIHEVDPMGLYSSIDYFVETAVRH